MTQDVKERPTEEKTTAEQPWQRLGQEVGNLVGALGHRAKSSLASRITTVTGRLQEYAEGGEAGQESKDTTATGQAGGMFRRAGNVVKGIGSVAKGIGQLRQGVTGKAGRKAEGDKTKVTNVIETIDIGAPVSVVYNQWTRFEDFPSFLKKVERVDQEADERLTWKAQILWSHRSWQSEIIEQVPDERIIWRSRGEKGHVDGAVTFHPLGPNLTRVALVLEYHPQGFFEHVGNLWRAQGRRARLELKHFRRHVMTQALLHPEEVMGWRGTIHEGRTVKEQPEEQAGEGREQPAGEQGGAEEQPKEPAREPDEERTGEQAGEGREESAEGQRQEATGEQAEDEKREEPADERGQRPEEPNEQRTEEAHAGAKT